MDPSRLNKISVLSHLSEAERRYVAAWATELSVPTGKVVMREHDFAYDLLMIVEGTAQVRHDDTKTVVAEIGPGDTVGEIGVLRRGLRSATVVATSPLVAVRLTRWDMRRLDGGAPNAARAIRALAAARIERAA